MYYSMFNRIICDDSIVIGGCGLLSGSGRGFDNPCEPVVLLDFVKSRDYIESIQQRAL